MPMIDKPGVQPLRPLLDDAAVTEIMINGPHQIFVERNGRMVEVPTVFTHPSQLDLLVDNLVVVWRHHARRPAQESRVSS